MSHILNIPHIKDNRVVRGYGIMQPKVSISLEAKNQTYFSKVFGGEEGVDGYSVLILILIKIYLEKGLLLVKG